MGLDSQNLGLNKKKRGWTRPIVFGIVLFMVLIGTYAYWQGLPTMDTDVGKALGSEATVHKVTTPDPPGKYGTLVVYKVLIGYDRKSNKVNIPIYTEHSYMFEFRRTYKGFMETLSHMHNCEPPCIAIQGVYNNIEIER